MLNFTPAEQSALSELAGVAEVIRGSLLGTKAAAPALRVHSLLSPPLEHPGTPGEVDRSVNQLREALDDLMAPETPLPSGLAVTKADIGRLRKQLDAAYGLAVRLFRNG